MKMMIRPLCNRWQNCWTSWQWWESGILRRGFSDWLPKALACLLTWWSLWTYLIFVASIISVNKNWLRGFFPQLKLYLCTQCVILHTMCHFYIRCVILLTVCRVAKCHGYDGYIRVKVFAEPGRRCNLAKFSPFWEDLHNYARFLCIN